MTVAVLRLLRPGDWVKNVFVAAPLVFWLGGAGRGASAESLNAMLVDSVIAFAAFCLAASGWYAINDALDAAEDRLHPRKRMRPVASGAMGSATAIAIGVGLAIVSLAVGRLAGEPVAWVIALYLLLQVLYNAGLKRVGFVDVGTIACGFCLRAIAGAVAISVPVSIWLLLCVFFLTTYLGFIKRTCDLTAAAKEAGSEWSQRAQYGSLAELNWLLSVSGGMTVLMYLMYTLSAHAMSLFGTRSLALALLSPLVLMAVHRFYRRAIDGESDSPLAALRDDRVLAWAVGLFVLGVYGALYSEAVDSVIRRVLLVV